MRSQKILDLPSTQYTNPLIEIAGPIDIGKTPIASLVAKRLNGAFISFPILTTTNVTGRSLLAALSTNTNALEASPNWWSHIYAANLYEQSLKISDYISRQPLVVTNYKVAFKLWMKNLGIDVSSYVRDLPSPSLIYILGGNHKIENSKPIYNFSEKLKISNKASFSHYRPIPKGKYISLDLLLGRSDREKVNQAAILIAEDVNNHFSCQINERALLGPSDVL